MATWRSWYWRWRWRGTEPPHCLGCGGPLVLQRIGMIRVRVDGMHVETRDLPVRACEAGCRDRRPGTPTMVADIMHAVLEQGMVPVARREPGTAADGEPQCRRCSSRQWRVRGAEAKVVHGLLHLGELPSFELSIAGPGRRCGGCGLVQLEPTPSLERDLAAALAQIWHAGGLRSGFR